MLKLNKYSGDVAYGGLRKWTPADRPAAGPRQARGSALFPQQVGAMEVGY